jgi:hypothetical protein
MARDSRSSPGGRWPKGITVTRADLRDPAAVLAHAGVRPAIDPGRPKCVIAAMALHFMPPGQAAEVTAGYMR